MGGIFIGLLVVSFVLLIILLEAFLSGKLESKIIINSLIELDNFSISLENGTYEGLKDIYFKNQRTENAVCLLGYEQNNIFHIKSLYQPQIYSKS
jgi:hypothetical protein